MKCVSVQILYGRFEKFGSQGRCSDQDLQSRPQRSIAVDNSNCSSVIGHGLSPTILLESQGGPRRPALSGHLRDYRAYRRGASCTGTVLLVQRDNSSEFRTLRCSLPSRSLSSFHFAK